MKLAVWGDPIEHSLSPLLHQAAYTRLGLDWQYERRRVDAASFDDTLNGLDASWRGLSATMPLKEIAFARTQVRGREAALTGAVNTILLGEGTPEGFNTDSGGIVGALTELELGAIPRARILGAGATAASALVALGELGVPRVDVVARRSEQLRQLESIAREIGVQVHGEDFTGTAEPVALTIATLPGGARLSPDVQERLAEAGGVLFDVAYSPWPSALAQAWVATGNRAVPGRQMLLHQALLQVRIFVGGAPDAQLPDEPGLLAAMRQALMGD